LERRWKAEEMLPLLTLVDDANSPEQGYYLLTAVQADAILDLKLHRLTGLERDSIHEEIKKIAELIQHHLFFLGSAEAIKDSIRKELLDIKERYSTPRRTLIETAATDVVEEDLIQKEDMVVTISLQGYIKRVPLDTYRSQRRGGRGRFGMTTKEEDIVNDVIVANTHDNILFFSTLGQVYSLKTYQLPVGGPQSKGRAMINLFPLSENEKISTILVIPSQEDCQQKTLIFATSFGNIRRNKVSDFARIASNGKKAMRLDEGEFLIGVKMATPDDDIFISTARAMANRFPVSSLRIFSGRESNGVRGIKLDDGDEVINISILDSHNISPEEREAYYKQSLLNKNEPVESSVVRPPEDREKLRFKRAENDRFQQTQNEAHSSETPGPNELDFANPERGRETPNDDSDNSVAFSMEKSRFDELAAQEQFILTVTEKGFGKRTSAYAYRTTNRGTKGVANMLMSSKVGKVVTSFPVSEIDDIILVTDLGRLIRCPVKDIRITRRLAMGVIIVRVNDQESVVAVSRAKSQDSDELQL
jgi:DNA gyrase subunit A